MYYYPIEVVLMVKERRFIMNRQSTAMKRLYEELKRIFRGYTKITSSICKRLKELNFTLVIGRKHCKVYYQNNFEHSVTIAKTPSDWRAGMNAASGLMALTAYNVDVVAA